jgi:tripeptide aminopeptidase
LGADNRAGAAVLLHTARTILLRKLPHPPLTFLWTVQEETGLRGARYVPLSWLGKPRLAFNFDGGAAKKITIGATGGYRLKIDIHGVASHAGGAPEQGVSAIAIAGLAISELVKNGWHGQIVKGSSYGTSNAGVIEGGVATNVVADHVRVRAEARSHDPRFRQRIARTIEMAFGRAARAVRNTRGRCGRIRCEGRLDYESFLLSPKEPCVVEADKAARSVGLETVHAVSQGGLDANWLTHRGIPTVSLGCGQRNIHTPSEELHVPDFLRACRMAMFLATQRPRSSP